MNAIIAVTGLGVLAMIGEMFRFRKILPVAILLGIAGAFVVNLLEWNSFIRYFNDMLYMDNFAIAFSAVLTAITGLWFLISGSHYKSSLVIADHYAIILFALVGGMIMVSFADLSMLFIGIEILSIAFYILASSNKAELRSNEAGFKYFIMGSFATGFLLFGIALIYGASGTFNLQNLSLYVSARGGDFPAIFYAGVLFVLVGMTFKVSAVPFHFWTPDVYEGAPTLITALMATLVKTAAFAALYRLFITCFAPVSDIWTQVIWVLAAASMLLGNILAVSQTSLKRMLAYSSIAHAGYMLLAVISVNAMSAPALLLYAIAYSVGSIMSFAILHLVSSQTGDESIHGLRGFAKTHPFQAGVLIITMLSLAGIPPLSGFFAKYYLFYAALQSGFTGLVLLAVVSSLIGVYYYLKVVITLFQQPEHQSKSINFSTGQTLFLALTALLTLLFGLAPDLIITLLN